VWEIGSNLTGILTGIGVSVAPILTGIGLYLNKRFHSDTAAGIARLEPKVAAAACSLNTPDTPVNTPTDVRNREV
jgi:hypothetical protein